MKDFIIATASTADLPAEYFEQHGIPFIRYTYTMNGESYDDDCLDSTRNSIYESMRQGALMGTSMINTYTYHEFFKSLMDTGKDVIYLDMTRQISSSFQNAETAAKEIAQEYPNQKFYLMDTFCVSGGLGLLVHAMVQLKEAGKSFEEVVKWGEDNKKHIIHWFTVDELKYLKRGGRVSNTAALVGSLLSIKPVLYVSDEGKLVAASKIRGRKAALLDIIEKMKKDFLSSKGQEVFINHADCLSDAEFMKEKILEAFPDVSKVTIMSLGAVVGAHCGPGLFTVFYIGDKRYA